MKNLSYFLLSFLALFLIFFALFYILNFNFALNKTLVAFLSILSSFLIIFISRKKIFNLSKFLLKIYLSLLFSFMISYTILLFFPKSNFKLLEIILFIFFIISFFLHFIIFYKKIKYGFFSFLILFFISIFLTFVISEMQKSLLRKYEKKLKSTGFSFEIKELFPFKYSKPLCEGWFEKFKVFYDDKNEKWKDFYNKYVLPYQEESFLKFLKEGKNPGDFITSDEKNRDKIWEEFFILNEEIKMEGEKCPHLQWFEPEDYKDKLLSAPLPPLLPLMKFSRTLETASIIMKVMGKEEEEEGLLKELYKAKEKMKIKGQPLINTLIRIAMEKVYILGEAFSISMEGKFSSEKIERIEKISRDDLSCLISSLNLDFFTVFLCLKNPKLEELLSSDLPIESKRFSRYIPKFVLRAFLYGETKNYLFNIYNSFENLKNVKVEENRYLWSKIKNLKLKPSYYYFDIKSTYARNLTSIAQARALLLSKEIFEFYFQNKKLPENIESFEGLDLVDPFSEKKLIYKKIDEEKFTVYSVGWDGKDDGGKELYISGATKIDKINQDIGFVFSVK